MIRYLVLLAGVLLALPALGQSTDKDVPWKAQQEILRRGAMVERLGGFQDASDPMTAISAAMQPPADDSHKWLFTMVTMKGCSWCEKMRSDFDNDPRLIAWVNTKDYTKSWAHWQVVQIEDQSQKWRWENFKPTVFPTLIVQPPVNGSWGDPHTMVFAQQGYMKPADLDAAIRKSIQLYAVKVFPKHLALASSIATQGISDNAGFQQGGGAPVGGWNPPVTPPSPLPPLPPFAPSPVGPLPPQVTPSVPPLDQTQIVLPSMSQLFSLLMTLLGTIFGSQTVGNFVLLTIMALLGLERLAPKTAKFDERIIALLKGPSSDPSPTATASAPAAVK